MAELIRRSRLGSAGGNYLDQPEELREEWRRSADRLLSEAKSADITIKDWNAA